MPSGKRTGRGLESTKPFALAERVRQGKNKHPTAGAADSRGRENNGSSSARGFDAGKKTNGRKRHILVATLGLMIAVCVTTACVQVRDGLKELLRTFGVHHKKLHKIWVDGGYRGAIIEWVKSRLRLSLEVVLRSDDVKGFVVLPKRSRCRANFCVALESSAIIKRLRTLPEDERNDDSDSDDSFNAS